MNERRDGAFPDHGSQLPAEVVDLIERMFWQSARTVEAVAPHQYNVRGWKKDDVTPKEFEALVRIVKAYGRREEWTSPAGFYDDGRRRRMTNTYLYVHTKAGFHAYWFTWPENSVAMLNRELVSQQSKTPTRRLPGTEPEPVIDTPEDDELRLF